MTPNQQREELSKAYVAAVVAACGFKMKAWSQDDDCVDTTIGAAGSLGAGTIASPRLDVQLKCSNDPSHLTADGLRWQLKRAHYDKLRARSMVPKVLVAVMLPVEPAEWVEHTPEELILRRCGYWLSLSGQPALNTGAESTTVHIPLTATFSPEALSGIMERLSHGGQP